MREKPASEAMKSLGRISASIALFTFLPVGLIFAQTSAVLMGITDRGEVISLDVETGAGTFTGLAEDQHSWIAGCPFLGTATARRAELPEKAARQLRMVRGTCYEGRPAGPDGESELVAWEGKDPEARSVGIT